MKIIEKAIEKAVSLYGGDILSKKDVFCILLDDMTPEQVEERQFIKMIYTDDVGRILNETLHATHGEKEKIYKKLDHYLEEKRGLLENVRIEFINIFRAALEQKIVEVKKNEDYKPALHKLKQEFEPKRSEEIIRSSIEGTDCFIELVLR